MKRGIEEPAIGIGGEYLIYLSYLPHSPKRRRSRQIELVRCVQGCEMWLTGLNRLQMTELVYLSFVTNSERLEEKL